MARTVLIESYTGEARLALMDGGRLLEMRHVRPFEGPVAFTTHDARVAETAPGGIGWFLEAGAGPLFLPRDRARRILKRDPQEGEALRIRVTREAMPRDDKTAVAEPCGTHSASPPPQAPAGAGRILHWHGEGPVTAITSNDRGLLGTLRSHLPDGIKLSHDEHPLARPETEEALSIAEAGAVSLPSGGKLTIEEGRTLTAIDVDSAASDPGRAGKRAQQQANMEAAEEIPRLMRLLGLGGIVVTDFIPAGGAVHRRAIEDAFRAGLSADPAGAECTDLSRFWLIEAERARRAPSIITQLAPGSLTARALAALRRLEREAITGQTPSLSALPGDIQDWLKNRPALLGEFAERTGHVLQ